MYELTDEAEAALAYAMQHRAKLPLTFDDNDRPAQPFIDLRDADLIKMETDWGHNLVILFDVLPKGIAHYQRVLGARRSFAPLEESADELLGAIAANRKLRKAGRTENLFDEDDERIEDFQALGRTGLLDIVWADNKAYRYEITGKGLSYVKGWFKEADLVINNNVQVNPTIQGAVAGSESSANAVAEAISSASAIDVIRAIDNSDLDDKEKSEARRALYELEDASKSKDSGKFLSALERISGIVKNAVEVSNSVIPIVAKFAASFLQ